MSPGGRPHDDQVRALAQDILAQHRYAQWRDTGSELLERFLAWIADYLAWTEKLQAESPLLYGIFVAGLSLVALLLVAHIVWSIRVALAVPAPAEPTPRSAQAPRWAEEAERLALQGRFLEGAHRLVLGSIEVLVKRDVIELGRAEANRVLRDRVRGSSLPSGVRDRFLALLDAFEERWFRDRLEDAALYRQWHELHANLRESARGPA